MKMICIVLFLLAFSCSSYAEQVQCKTNINGAVRFLSYYEYEYEINENYTWRENLFHGWGDITCPAFITLRYFTPKLTDYERSVFCLKFDKELDTYTGFVNGTRNAYLVCKEPKKTFCERVNETKDAAIAITGLAAGAVGGGTAAGTAGITAVAHSSGAVILTGTGGYIAGTLGSIGATSLAVVTAPATIAATVVSVVTVGGAVYLCRDKDSDETTE